MTNNIKNLSLDQLDKQIQQLQIQRKQLLEAKGNKLPDKETYSCSKDGNCNVVVVGGHGQFGRLFVSLFERSGYQVSILGRDDWLQSDAVLSRAALVLIAVPINVTLKIIEKLHNLPEDCVLADVTSIKKQPLQAMLNTHSGPVVGLHPMFGPDNRNLNNQTVIICNGRNPSKFQWLVDQLQCWQAVTYQISAEQHDSAMAMVQVMRHFSTIAYGYHLMQEDTNLAEIIKMSSPIYRLELAMTGRLFAQDPELYTDIIFSNLDNVDMLKRFIQRFEELLDAMESDNKQEFCKIFDATSQWFGDYADQFLAESSEMLIHTNKAVIK